MTNLMKITWIGFLPLLLVACQKGPSSNTSQQPEALLQQDSLSIDCGNLSQNEIRNARLVGPETVTQNKAATFALAGVSNCGAHQKLMTFTEPGTFQVSASLKTDSGTVQLTAITQVVGSSLELTGPVIGVEGLPLVFSLSNPDNLVINSLAWDFGDGNTSVGGTSATTVYSMPGEYVVAAVATFADGSSKQVTHALTVVPLEDSFLCVKGFAVVSPATGVAGEAIDMSVFLPSCLQGKVTHVAWNFGDASAGNGLSVTHTYNQEGVYDVIVSVFHPNTDVLWFNYPVKITVSAATSSTTSTTLPPVCVEGTTRDKLEPITSVTLQCGVNGQQTTDSQVTITEQCQRVGGVLGFFEVNRKTQVVRVGLCEGQSCQLPDGAFIRDGDSRLMYSSQLPASSCASVSQVRTCQNGVLAGTSSFSHLNCTNGCENFGPSGTVKSAVVTGQTQVALTCQYGETGFFDLFNQVADQTCQSGTVVTSNSRTGSLITKGQCPVYGWVGTEEYTACTAACGGTQTRIYQCQDASGQLALPERCGVLTAENRACDGDPAQVRRVETSTTTEEANSSAICPKNQIGVIVNQREITTTKTFACIDHSVQLESSVNTAAPWVEERYCRDYVAHRCSQDSLNNAQGKKRMEWMVRCANQVPLIKEFLENFATVTGDVNGAEYSLTSNSRVLYPTFMNRVGKTEKPWIAPKGTGSDNNCTVPSTAYIAAVCVSSCATPEEQIIAQEVASGKLAAVTFIQALTKNYQFVGTLASHSGMSSRELKKTKVDQWVTELLDTDHEILEFRTLSGGLLKVTPNHPLVSDEGKMKLAVDFKVGESLVKLGGVKDEIVSITEVPYFGKVYNLFVKSADPIKNVVVTNGYLNGTAFYQNEGSKHLNRVIFRKRVTQGVFE